MERSIIIFAVLLLTAFSAMTQPDPFNFTWGNIGQSEGGEDVVQIESGSIFYCGFSVLGPSTTKIEVFKLSASGEILEEWSFGPSGQHVPYQMKWVNGTLVLAGQTTSPGGDIDGFWLRVDTLGNELSWSTFGISSRTEVFYSFDVDDAGNFVACGFATGSESEANNALIALFDPAFSTIWVAEEDYEGTDVAISVAVVEGSEYVITGDRITGNGYFNLFVSRYDGSGEEIWEYFEDTGYNGGSKGIMVNSADEIIVVGESSGPGFVPFEPTFTRLSGEGDLIVQTYIESSTSSDASFSVYEPIPGNYLIAGYGNNPESGSVDAVVIYTDGMGIEVTRDFYDFSEGNDIAFSIVPSIYDGFMVAGRSGNFDEGYFLVYDYIPLSLGIGSDKPLEKLTAFPNPIARGEQVNFLNEWHFAEVIDSAGNVRKVRNGQEVSFDQSGVYRIRFYDLKHQPLGIASVVCTE